MASGMLRVLGRAQSLAQDFLHMFAAAALFCEDRKLAPSPGSPVEVSGNPTDRQTRVHVCKFIIISFHSL